jgi:hypothetical protein
LKYIILLAISFYLISCSANQISVKCNFKIIELKEFYSGQGAIIPDTSKEYFGGRINSNRFTPSIEQIRLAESILSNDIYNYYWKVYYFSGFFYSETKDSTDLYEEFIDEVANYKNDLTFFNRYYLAYRDESNEDIIQISIFNFSTCETKDLFEKWQEEYLWRLESLSEFMRTYKINLNRNEIEHF